MPGVAFRLRVLRVFFLEVRGIKQQQVAELMRGGVGENRAAKPITNDARQITGVVNVRVREDDPVDGCGIYRQAVPVFRAQLARTLKKSAINEQAFASRFDQIL